MNNNRWISLLLAVTLAACGGAHKDAAAPQNTGADPSSTAPAASGGGDVDAPEAIVAKAENFAVRMCACHDAKCAQPVSDELDQWAKAKEQRALAAHTSGNVKFTDAQQHQIEDSSSRFTGCMQKAMNP